MKTHPKLVRISGLQTLDFISYLFGLAFVIFGGFDVLL